MSRNYEYVRTTYGVPAYVGKRVMDDRGRKGTIIEPAEGTGAHVTVRLDTQRRGAPYHPNSITYLSDEEPPAPRLAPDIEDDYTFDGKVVGVDPWQTEACRIILYRGEWDVVLVAGPHLAKDRWDAYGINEHFPGMPEEPGFYEATFLCTTWPWEGDEERRLVDITPMAKPKPTWGKNKCGRCSSDAVLPWPTTTDGPEVKRYRCIDCNQETHIQMGEAKAIAQ